MKKAIKTKLPVALMITAALIVLNSFFGVFAGIWNVITTTAYGAAAFTVPGGMRGLFGSSLNLGINKDGTLRFDTVFVSEKKAYSESFGTDEIGVPSETSSVSPENSGRIVEECFRTDAGGSVVQSGYGLVRNATGHTNEAVAEMISKKPEFKLLNDGSIEVLILHTHATESYNTDDSGYYDKNAPTRTSDNEHNMVKVGNALFEELKKLGVGVVHDKTLHDEASFGGAYTREAQTVAKYLEKYPSIKIIFDLHRDAIEREDGTRVKPVTLVNGKKAAQIMLLSGCDNGNMNFPKWEQNLRLNAMLVNNIERLVPGLSRPVFFNYSKYNQNLLPGATLIEMGGHANTIEEAVYSARLLARPIYETLLELK